MSRAAAYPGWEFPLDPDDPRVQPSQRALVARYAHDAGKQGFIYADVVIDALTVWYQVVARDTDSKHSIDIFVGVPRATPTPDDWGAVLWGLVDRAHTAVRDFYYYAAWH